MRLLIIFLAILAVPLPLASAQTAVAYRFESKSASGTVWIAGDSARRKSAPKEESAAGPSVEISKEGGKRILALNTAERTYYDVVAYRAKDPGQLPSLAALNVRNPFVVAGVKNVRVEVAPTKQDAIAEKATSCRPMTFTLSYDLRLRLTMADGNFPGRVEGRGEFCLADAPPITTLPFGHGLQLVTGIQEVDALLAERLAPLKGVPVKRNLTVTRHIEGGETVTDTSELVLSDIREVQIPQGHFEVPTGYRYQEPVIIGPARQKP